MKYLTISQQESVLIVVSIVCSLLSSFFLRRSLEKNKYKKRVPNIEEKITKDSYQMSLTYSFSKRLEMYEKFFAYFMPMLVSFSLFFMGILYIEVHNRNIERFDIYSFFRRGGYISIAFLLCTIVANKFAHLKYKDEYKDEIRCDLK